MLSLFDTCVCFIAANAYLLDRDSLPGISSDIGSKIAKLLVRHQPLNAQDVKLIQCFWEAFGLVALSSLKLNGFSCLSEPSNSVVAALENPERVTLLNIIQLNYVMHLGLRGCTAVCDNEVLGVIGQLNRLRRLDLSQIGMDDRHVIMLRGCTSIRGKGLTSLLSLNVSDNLLTIHGACKLQGFPSLTELDIQSNLITKEGLKGLCCNGWDESAQPLLEITTQGWLKDYLTPRLSRNSKCKPSVSSQQYGVLIRRSPNNRGWMTPNNGKSTASNNGGSTAPNNGGSTADQQEEKRAEVDERVNGARAVKRARLDDELLDQYK